MTLGRGFKKKLEISILLQLKGDDPIRLCMYGVCTEDFTHGKPYYLAGKLLATHYAKQWDMTDPIFARMFVS